MDKFLDGISQVFSGDALVAIVAGLAVAFFVKVIPRLIAGVPFIAPRDLKKRLDAGEEAVIIDVREPDEFNDALGHIPGALNVPPSRLSERVKFLKADLAEYADIPVYLTCKSSSRAASAARTLKGAGLRKIHVVTGGMLKWNRQGPPVTRG